MTNPTSPKVGPGETSTGRNSEVVKIAALCADRINDDGSRTRVLVDVFFDRRKAGRLVRRAIYGSSGRATLGYGLLVAKRIEEVKP